MNEERVTKMVVMLPGMDGTGRLFAPFIEALGPEFNSTPVTYPADRALPYAQLKEFVSERLPASDPFVLLAESFSTPLAIEIAAAQPEALKALILVAGFATNPSYAWVRRMIELCRCGALMKSCQSNLK